MEVDGVKYRIAINVRSSRGPVAKRLIEYCIKDDLNHPTINHAKALPFGWNPLKTGAQHHDAAIDYIRSNIFRATDMKPMTHTEPGPNNDLFEFIEDVLDRAISQNGVVYAFGERWGPEATKQDQYFDFLPGNGVHLIHMNQGDSGGGNSTFQDGALVVDFPTAGKTAGIFFKFQSQVWHTSEDDGTPLPGTPTVPVVPIPTTGPVKPWPVVPLDSPYHLARIIAAIVNPRGDDPQKESVTILNTSDDTLDVRDWRILDQHDKADAISGKLEPGEALVFRLTGNGAQLGNKGGTISLLNKAGLKVDGVAYHR